jgi:mono/diheme cytochrome c family protein
MKTAAAVLLLCVLAMPVLADDGAALFKTKCAMCHGADGKKMPKADLSSAAVQGKSDADLAKFVAENPKHNFAKKGLTDPQINDVVKFLRTLK